MFLTFFITYLIHFCLLHIVNSIYMHRGIVHGMIKYHPVLENIFRVYMWAGGLMSSNMYTYFTAQHRKHHKFSDTKDDPHSPYNGQFSAMFDYQHNDPTRNYYVSPEDIQKYSKGVVNPTDWIQTVLCDKYLPYGHIATSIIYFMFFGLTGMLLYLLLESNRIYLTIFAGNYLAHKHGFRYAGNRGTDKSVILFPVAVLFGGEELHSNHHNYPKDPKFSRTWWEFDIGWAVIQLLIWCRLAKLVRDRK